RHLHFDITHISIITIEWLPSIARNDLGFTTLHTLMIDFDCRSINRAVVLPLLSSISAIEFPTRVLIVEYNHDYDIYTRRTDGLLEDRSDFVETCALEKLTIARTDDERVVERIDWFLGKTDLITFGWPMVRKSEGKRMTRKMGEDNVRCQPLR
ncbi:hypothetical protein EK21DRAFT_67919, partial [Setomelanomma holmii]